MLNISCTYCRAPISVSDAELAEIVQGVGSKSAKSVPIVCHSCRRANKVARKRVEQAYRQAGSPPVTVPPTDTLETTEPQDPS